MKTKQEIVANWLPRYTKRKLEDFGEYILLTNFNKYVDIFLTKSSKSPASIAKSNKQGWGLACIRRGQAPSDKLRSSYLVMSK